MNTIVRVAGVVLASTSLVGCATVLRGTRQDYTIETTPSGATATLSNGESCVTPCELHLKRGREFNVQFELDGYQTGWVAVDSVFSGGGAAGVAGNVLLGGIIGAGVDASNGSLNNLEPNPLRVTLSPVGSANASTYIDEDGEVIALRTDDQFRSSGIATASAGTAAEAEVVSSNPYEPGIVAIETDEPVAASEVVTEDTATPVDAEIDSGAGDTGATDGETDA